MAIMFGAPPEKDLNFDEKVLSNMKSYLDRVQRLADKVNNLEEVEIQIKDLHGKKEFTDILKLLEEYNHKMDNQRFFHVAVARLMEITNIMQKTQDHEVLVAAFPLLVRALYPFCPHLASDIWSSLHSKV